MQAKASLSPWGATVTGLTPNLSPFLPENTNQYSKRSKHYGGGGDNSDLTVLDNANYVLPSPSFKKPPLH